MAIKKQTILGSLIQALIITAIGLLLGITSIHKILDLLDFTKSVNGGDFQMSDVYNNVDENRSVKTLCNDVVIVPIDGYGRPEIADILTTIESMNPAVVGMDIMFVEEHEGDEYLINSINSCSNVVLPLALDAQSGNCMGAYFYDDLEAAKFGIVNLDITSSNESVRTYQTVYELGERLVNGFALEIASTVSMEAYKKGKLTRLL